MYIKNEGGLIKDLALLQCQLYLNLAPFQSLKCSQGMLFMAMYWPSASISEVRIEQLVILI